MRDEPPDRQHSRLARQPTAVGPDVVSLGRVRRFAIFAVAFPLSLGLTTPAPAQVADEQLQAGVAATQAQAPSEQPVAAAQQVRGETAQAPSAAPPPAEAAQQPPAETEPPPTETSPAPTETEEAPTETEQAPHRREPPPDEVPQYCDPLSNDCPGGAPPGGARSRRVKPLRRPQALSATAAGQLPVTGVSVALLLLAGATLLGGAWRS